jgi:hypothetical protein
VLFLLSLISRRFTKLGLKPSTTSEKFKLNIKKKYENVLFDDAGQNILRTRLDYGRWDRENNTAEQDWGADRLIILFEWMYCIPWTLTDRLFMVTPMSNAKKVSGFNPLTYFFAILLLFISGVIERRRLQERVRRSVWTLLQQFNTRKRPFIWKSRNKQHNYQNSHRFIDVFSP